MSRTGLLSILEMNRSGRRRPARLEPQAEFEVVEPVICSQKALSFLSSYTDFYLLETSRYKWNGSEDKQILDMVAQERQSFTTYLALFREQLRILYIELASVTSMI